MVHRSASRQLILAAIVLIASRPFEATASDLDLLARLLIPGYIAQDFAAVCGANNSGFLPEIPGGSAAVAAYAQHLKIEVTIGLTQSEAMNVMLNAADTALAVAGKEVKQLNQENSTEANNSLRVWCERSAKPFILGIIRAHVKKHTRFDRMVEDAKH